MNYIFGTKKTTTFLIYGSSGWIGGLFMKYLKNNHLKIKVLEGVSRVDDEEAVLQELSTRKPTHVISFIGRTHGKHENKLINNIDYLEYPGKLIENIRDNLFAPIMLADICKDLKIHYTYLGTGCIYNGKEIFDENCLPNYFGSSYSVVKGFTDRLIRNYNALNLRIRMPISSEPNSRNFITKIAGYERICSIANSMTVLDDFFPIFTDLMLKKKTGAYNCTNPGTVTHNRILKLYKNIIDPNFAWKNMTISEQSKILKSERSNNSLNTSKIEDEYPQLKDIDTAVNDVLVKMKTKM